MRKQLDEWKKEEQEREQEFSQRRGLMDNVGWASQQTISRGSQATDPPTCDPLRQCCSKCGDINCHVCYRVVLVLSKVDASTRPLDAFTSVPDGCSCDCGLWCRYNGNHLPHHHWYGSFRPGRLLLPCTGTGSGSSQVLPVQHVVTEGCDV